MSSFADSRERTKKNRSLPEKGFATNQPDGTKESFESESCRSTSSNVLVASLGKNDCFGQMISAMSSFVKAKIVFTVSEVSFMRWISA